MRLLDRATLAPLLDTWRQPNSDFFPALDLGAEKARYLETSAHGLVGLGEARFAMVAPFFGQRMGFSSTREVPVRRHPHLYARALGATLRAWRDDGALPAPPEDEDVRAALQRLWQWHNILATPHPPADWRLWLQETMQVEADLHGGTAGTVDETFYQALHHYLDQHTPPPEVCDAVLFLEGLGRWDFAAASSAADRLLQSAVDGTSWMPVDQLRDGAVAAKLLLGDTAGARQYLEALAAQAKRDQRDLRSRLLEAYVAQAHKLPPRSVPSPSLSWTCRATPDSTSKP
jgi:hypothetical protein